jgi:DNA (cytosine-5)-methyltransferase 1
MRVADAFCGVGGFSCGALDAGCSVIMGVESESAALRLWRSNTQGEAVLATIGVDQVPWPPPHVSVHFSPPCTALSKARCAAPRSEVEGGLAMLKLSLDLVIEKGYTKWSLENVSTVATRELLDSYCSRYPGTIAHTTVDAADFGVPQNRTRLIASTPGTIRLLKQEPVRRVSVETAFAEVGRLLPAKHFKSSTKNRGGTPCVRSVQEPAFCVTASHPLTWCAHDGTTVRCFTPAETAVVQGFPSSWRLPSGSRAGIRAVGNAIPPPLAEAIARCAMRAAGLAPRDQVCLNPAPRANAGAKRKRSGRLRALETRVARLEALVCENRR